MRLNTNFFTLTNTGSSLSVIVICLLIGTTGYSQQSQTKSSKSTTQILNSGGLKSSEIIKEIPENMIGEETPDPAQEKSITNPLLVEKRQREKFEKENGGK